VADDVAFCTTPDGGRIAYATTGNGLPLVVCPALAEQFSTLHQVPTWQAFADRIGEGRRVVRYDSRGTGLSERDTTDFSLETRLTDLDTVVKAARLRRFALYGSLFSGPLAIAYTARNPRRVSHLILYGTFCRGVDVMPWERLGPLLELARTNWPLAAQTLADMSGDIESRQRYPEAGVQIAAHFSASTSGRVFAEGLTAGYRDDVSALLPSIAAPTLVLHRRNDPIIPFALGQELAGRIPKARLAPLTGAVHGEFLGDIDELLHAIDTFLGQAPARRRASRAAPLIILFTDMESSTSLTQRLGDAGAQELVRAHNEIVRDALRSHAGDEIKHTGDGIMASFPSASGALECAIAIQRGLAHRNQEGAAQAVNVRIGLNAGEPVREQEDLFGQAVQLARRICDRAAPGQILASNVVRELVAGKGFLFSDLGESALRGFEDPVRVYEVRWAE
jgi:class 3 adenylate cyclase